MKAEKWLRNTDL